MTENATRMPALYIGHGAPPLLDDAAVEPPAGRLGTRDLPRPRRS